VPELLKIVPVLLKKYKDKTYFKYFLTFYPTSL
jgi:hypothetical protein